MNVNIKYNVKLSNEKYQEMPHEKILDVLKIHTEVIYRDMKANEQNVLTVLINLTACTLALSE